MPSAAITKVLSPITGFQLFRASAFITIHLAVLHDKEYAASHFDVIQGISRNRNHISLFTGSKRADLL